MSIAKCGYRDLEKYKKQRNASRDRYYKKTSKYKRKSWEVDEDEQVLAHNVSDAVLSELLCRSVHAIQDRRYQLNKKKLEDEKQNKN